MILLPAIDLMGGEVVRLKQGRAAEKTVYASDPVPFAQRWEAAGGDFLHLVDLDAAFGGESRNLEAVRRVVEAVKIPCELGGGMRDRAAVERALAAGVTRVVIGTRAAESLEFVAATVAEFGSERVAVGIDARDGFVAVRGWTEVLAQPALELARQAGEAGAGAIIYTDIATDGMLAGPNLTALAEVASALPGLVIASGGVSSLDDLERLAEIPGLMGAIIGRALYEGQLDLSLWTKR